MDFSSLEVSRRAFFKLGAAAAGTAALAGNVLARAIPTNQVGTLGVQAVTLPAWPTADVDVLAASIAARPGPHAVGACVSLNAAGVPGYVRIRRLLDMVHGINPDKDLTLILHLSCRGVEQNAMKWDTPRLTGGDLGVLIGRFVRGREALARQLSSAPLPRLRILWSPGLQDPWARTDTVGRYGTDSILSAMNAAVAGSTNESTLRCPMPGNDNSAHSGAAKLELHSSSASAAHADFISNLGVPDAAAASTSANFLLWRPEFSAHPRHVAAAAGTNQFRAEPAMLVGGRILTPGGVAVLNRFLAA